jgi:phage repressor protein C with HTH and peptisase S24 domain
LRYHVSPSFFRVAGDFTKEFSYWTITPNLSKEISYAMRKNMTAANLIVDDPVRTALEGLIADRGDDYQSLSRMLGRNPAYVQQFLKRGSPRRLAEEDRIKLARYYGVDEAMLGAPAQSATPPSGLRTGFVPIPRYDVGASAGPGALAEDEQQQGSIGFDARWLRSIGRDPARLSMLKVTGDSMEPLLMDGDDILVDQSDTAPIRSGALYVFRNRGELKVKRLEPGGQSLVIRSENPRFHPVVVHDLAEVSIIGRVVWSGRKLA